MQHDGRDEKEFKGPATKALLAWFDQYIPGLQKKAVHPNHFTTITLITSALALYILAKGTQDNALLAGVLFTLCLVTRAVTDILDGYYARRTGTVTTVGDFYDHGVDVLFLIGAIFIVCCQWRCFKLGPGAKMVLLGVSFLMFGLLTSHIFLEKRVLDTTGPCYAFALNKIPMAAAERGEAHLRFIDALVMSLVAGAMATYVFCNKTKTPCT